MSMHASSNNETFNLDDPAGNRFVDWFKIYVVVLIRIFTLQVLIV